MDRRTLAAFAVIALIIIATPYYMRVVRGEDPFQSPPPVENRYDAPLGDALPATRPQRPLDASPTLPEVAPVPQPPDGERTNADQTAIAVEPGESAPDVRVTVDTERYAAVFSASGGRLVSLHLKDYFDSEGQLLELIPPGASGLGVRLGDTDLSGIPFTPDKTSLALFGTEQDELRFSAVVDGRRLVKRIRFQGDRYRMQVSLSIDRLQQRESLGLTWDGPLSHTENLLVRDPTYSNIVTLAGGEVETWDPERLRGEEKAPSGLVTWVGVRNKFFLSALIPPEGRYDLDLSAAAEVHVLASGSRTEQTLRSQLASGDLRGVRQILNSQFQGQQAFVLQLNAGVDAHALAASLQQHPDVGMAYADEHFQASVIPEEAETDITYDLYLGPITYHLLRSQNTDLNGVTRELEMDNFMDYGWAFLRPVMKPMTIVILRAFLSLHQVVPNYGLVIIIFSILVKIVVFPLTHKSLEAAAKMQQLQPQITALREKHGEDKQKLNTDMMKLYKDQKINPLGGCLPMFLQMPILISLFNVFRSAIELRQAGFMFWITDLSRPDQLIIGDVDVHILPLLMGVSSFFQSKLTMKDPKQAAMVYVMPVMMTFIFWSFASGLVLYWTMFNLLTLIQQRLMETTKEALGAK